MCYFPKNNTDYNSTAYKRGLSHFECGSCPECLSKRSSKWALRACYAAKTRPACMVTLTYDEYIYDDKGDIVGEDCSAHNVDKKHCQDFIKRLRRYFDYHENNKNISYLITAEYGKRRRYDSNGNVFYRAHYHALLFGVQFPDLIQYKKSKRGNTIYKSSLLGRLWKHGICTVDCTAVSSKIARYCTKYCCKQYGADDTFMLFSQNLGTAELLADFSGQPYIINGQSYPIPSAIWKKWFLQNTPFKKYAPFVAYRNYKQIYNETLVDFCSKGVFRPFRDEFLKKFREKSLFYKKKREEFSNILYNSFAFQKYVEKMRYNAELRKKNEPSLFEKVLDLPNKQYFSYKQKVLHYLEQVPGLYNPPRCSQNRLHRAIYWSRSRCFLYYEKESCAIPPCHISATDTKRKDKNDFNTLYSSIFDKNNTDLVYFSPKQYVYMIKKAFSTPIFRKNFRIA